VKRPMFGCGECPVRDIAFYGCTLDLERQRGVVRRLPARSTIATAGTEGASIYTVRSGWAIAYRHAPGGRRQILDFVLPGDIVNLELLVGRETTCSVRSITPVVLCGYSAATIQEILSRHPAAQARLVRSLLQTLRDAGNRIVDLGARSAAQAIAAMVLDVRRRLSERGMIRGDRFDWPVTQEIVADLLGISRVHVTRMFAQLRNDGLMDVRSGKIVIPDHERLRAFAEGM